MRIEQKAYAKINLSLDVVGRREDGYHELVSVMQSVSLFDELCFERNGGEGILLHSDLPELNDENNLVCRAARAYFAARGTSFGVSVELKKHIPMQAGLGGGSADAAATLRALNELDGRPFSIEELASIGARVGADVPFCVVGGTQLCRGIGERMEGIENNLSAFVAVVMADEGISTPQAFRALDEKYGDFSALSKAASERAARLGEALGKGDCTQVAALLENRFEEVVFPVRPQAKHAKEHLLKNGAYAAQMSGSGPAVFGLFETEEAASAAIGGLAMRSFVCRFV